ncbi:MAG: 3-oxoacyl-[acyl-carrier-protein] synthase III C-terminal domain-containing protein [Verrucomicrobiota bacterium]
MANCSFKKSQIRGLVTCVPSKEKRIDDELDLFDGNTKQIARLKKTIGLDRRRVVCNDETTADLCESAARRLFSETDLAESSVDALIFVTQTPDYSQPCNAAVLHGRLGLEKSVAAFDVNLGCSGYVYGLWLSYMMIESGSCQNILLLAGDTISRVVHPKDRTVAPLFGDGGSATWITRSGEESVSWFNLGTDGLGYDKLIIPAGGFRAPSSSKSKAEITDQEGNVRTAESLHMDGAEIFNFSISEEPSAVRELLDFAKIDQEEIDYFVFHQANRYILKNIAKRLKIPDSKVPMQTVERFGNQSSASIPSAICGELSPILKDANKTKLFLSGFGVGLSWGSAIIEASNVKICEIIEYK